MITQIAPIKETPRWQKLLDEAITEPKQLLQTLNLDLDLLPQMAGGHQQFKIKVPAPYIKRIVKADPTDPLLLQILPVAEETTLQPIDFTSDPVGDLQASPVPGLIHKYKNRVLLITSPACAIHCRYCFRREFPYRDSITSGENWQRAQQYLSNHPEINEVILSGGDPLTLPDQKLSQLSDDLCGITHIKTLRIHSRLPIVLPERITTSLLGWLASLPLRVVMVVHCNHPNELDDSVKQALLQLKEAGVTLYNQTVILKNVNDNTETLALLSEKLFEYGVQPYYLHILDKVNGAAHFDVTLDRCKRIYQGLASRLPGYLLPRLVQDLPGRPAKEIIL